MNDLLQQINELKEENKKLNYIIEKQDRDIIALSKGNKKLKSRIEKAIEYIKGTIFFGLRSGKTIMSKYLNELLNILEGRSDE